MEGRAWGKGAALLHIPDPAAADALADAGAGR